MTPRVFTIPPDEPFLEVLARAVLAGFPNGPTELARCRILVPTRRAARDLERIFFALSGGAGLLLPRISPLGDIDEELFGFSADASLPDAITPIGRDLLLVGLVDEWARTNAQLHLAAEILGSPQQALALALSLTELIDALETEEVDLAGIPELYGLESARHREAILDFLALARERLPAMLHERGLIGPAARRSLVLRREAVRLKENPPQWPVIAAGSTASIPATRELLTVIASLPTGAVVLPGLDNLMDGPSWDSVNEQHPQFALKQFLERLEISRSDVITLPEAARNTRSWLASEIMRPAATSHDWSEIIRERKTALASALGGIELVEARHVHEEARIIALMLRQTLETPGATASLVTPDRDLARRVKQELVRFHIDIDDSAGEPLIRFDGAALLDQLIEASLSGFAADRVVALLKQDLCSFGFEQAARAASVVEIALTRNGHVPFTIEGLGPAVAAAQKAVAEDAQAHPVLKAFSAEDWTLAVDFATCVANGLRGLQASDHTDFRRHLDTLVQAAETAAGGQFWSGATGELLAGLLQDLRAGELAACGFAQAAIIVRHYLASTPFRKPQAAESRLSVLGLLEARLARPDRMILGGLNEGRWPSLPDSGPWLNRPMREKLAMQLPEREIGQTAHDLAQALGCNAVFLVWARRVGQDPAIASRWILRLQMLMQAAGITRQQGDWSAIAASLDAPDSVVPSARPRPTPPLEARPRRLSVTRIETLIRDPYAIYARSVLGLQPLDEISTEPDMALRGTVFHHAIGEFLQQYPESLPDDALARMLDYGRRSFAPLMIHPEIAGFWWPQFERIAQWFVIDEMQRRGPTRILAEIDGKLALDVAGVAFTLSARADRVDLLGGGEARIIDYKTGAVPTGPQVASGLAPQLTLQAAMLERGAFAKAGALRTVEIAYVKLGIGETPGEYSYPSRKEPVMDMAHRHMAGLVTLLSSYANPAQPYLPRVVTEKEDETRDYDHLSRYREWVLSGAGT